MRVAEESTPPVYNMLVTAYFSRAGDCQKAYDDFCNVARGKVRFSTLDSFGHFGNFVKYYYPDFADKVDFDDPILQGVVLKVAGLYSDKSGENTFHMSIRSKNKDVFAFLRVIFRDFYPSFYKLMAPGIGEEKCKA